ncbi:MAG: hypothetical protein ABIK93_01070 [candidate division WOR-3 bacterium]
MEGFHRLEWMDYYVTEKAPGVYLLSNDGEVVLDIGRSDIDVGQELKALVNTPRGIDSKYAYFWFSYANNPFEAFNLHCKLWHRFRRSNGNFDTHPRPPQGENWPCPVDGCEFNEPRKDEI